MDAHRLRSVFDLLLAEHSRLEIDRKLARILQSLAECISNPSSASDGQFRAVLTDLLATLRRSATNDLVESDRRILAEIGGEQFTGEGLAETVLAIANERPFLAGRAKEAFVQLADELQSHLGAVGSVQASLSKLNVGPLQLASDEGAAASV